MIIFALNKCNLIIMVIDFNEIATERIENFKGGEGLLLTRNFVDEKCRIMHSVLTPGARSGEHTHVNNCEIVMILSGEATFVYDGHEEVVGEGQVHYCPMGHRHYMVNKTDRDIVYFAIVPEHH